MSNALTIVHVCAECAEGRLALAGAGTSHGLCRRHFVEALRELGCSATEIEAAVSGFSAGSFCEELSGGQTGEVHGTEAGA